MEEMNSPEALCIFEDDRYPNFFPLSINKPVFELLSGTQTLRERMQVDLAPSATILLCRSFLAETLGESMGTEDEESTVTINEPGEMPTIFVNGRLLALGEELVKCVEQAEDGSVLHKSGVPVVARLSGEKARSFAGFLLEPLSDDKVSRLFNRLKDMKNSVEEGEGAIEEKKIEADEKKLNEWARSAGVKLIPTGYKLLSYYWQFIGENGNCIRDDFQKSPFRGSAPESALFKGVDLINEEDIVIGSEVEVRSGTVLDASEGPIIIADSVKIEPNAIIYGPCYIGEGSIIRGGAKIGKDTSIGSQSRIGGEVGESIISSYTNKQHEGFIGHSYIGSWVNIGAGSCNSDLKNNYGMIRAWSGGIYRETGRRFLGLVAGDHSKIAINTRINTGSVIGFCSNVMTAGFPPKFVPSFVWQLEPECVEFELAKAVRTAEIMMDRRDVAFTPAMEELFRTINRLCRQSGYNS